MSAEVIPFPRARPRLMVEQKPRRVSKAKPELSIWKDRDGWIVDVCSAGGDSWAILGTFDCEFEAKGYVRHLMATGDYCVPDGAA